MIIIAAFLLAILILTATLAWLEVNLREKENQSMRNYLERNTNERL